MTGQKIACARVDHPEGYIQLTFLESSYESVNALIVHLTKINQEVPPAAPPLKILITSRPGVQAQPIIYLLRRLREEQSHLRPRYPTKLAIIFHFLPLASLLESFFRTLRTPHFRFKAFGRTQAEAAIQWLRRE
jgi:hypothetical protein